VFLCGEQLITSWHIEVASPAPRALTTIKANCFLAEAAARIDVLSSILLAIVASCLAVGYFARQLLFSPLPRKVPLLSVCAYAVYLAIGVYFVRNGADAVQTYGEDWIGKHLPAGRLELLKLFLNVVNGSLIFATAAAIAGTISCILRPNEQDAVEWKARLSSAQTWLYISAGLLVCGLLFHRAWGTWLGSCLDAQDEISGFSQLVTAFTANRAVQFSCFLAAFYVPVLAVLSHQARSIPSDGSPVGVDRSSDGKADKEGPIPWVEMLKSVVGILMPFVVGLLGAVADMLKG
jgi:hypothetical protein